MKMMKKALLGLTLLGLAGALHAETVSINVDAKLQQKAAAEAAVKRAYLDLLFDYAKAMDIKVAGWSVRKEVDDYDGRVTNWFRVDVRGTAPRSFYRADLEKLAAYRQLTNGECVTNRSFVWKYALTYSIVKPIVLMHEGNTIEGAFTMTTYQEPPNNEALCFSTHTKDYGGDNYTEINLSPEELKLVDGIYTDSPAYVVPGSHHPCHEKMRFHPYPSVDAFLEAEKIACEKMGVPVP